MWMAINRGRHDNQHPAAGGIHVAARALEALAYGEIRLRDRRAAARRTEQDDDEKCCGSSRRPGKQHALAPTESVHP